MKKVDYDEYQINVIKNLGLQTLVIILSAIIINSIVSIFYNWALIITQTFIFVYLGAFYFTIGAINNNVFFTNNQNSYNTIIISYLLVAILNTIIFITIISVIGYNYYFDNGMIKAGIFIPINIFYFVTISIYLIIINKKRHKRGF